MKREGPDYYGNVISLVISSTAVSRALVEGESYTYVEDVEAFNEAWQKMGLKSE